jgi:hypothetical protein
VTAQRASEYILPAELLPTLPAAGQYLRCPGKAGTALLLSTVRKVGGDSRPMVRLIGLRVRAKDIPTTAEPIPWPREKRRPSHAAEPPAPTDRPIVTRATKAKIERERIRTQRRELASDPANQLVSPERRANGTAVADNRVDISDLNPNRRTARRVIAFKNIDCLDTLQQAGTLTRQMVGAAKRLRRDYEIGCLQTNGAVNWESTPSATGSVPLGVSERVLQFLERYQNARSAMGRLFEIVYCVCLQEVTLRDYATRNKINPSSASGRLYAALQALQDWYDRIDPSPEEKIRHSIGPQLGDQQQLEPSQPPAAARWAAD